RPPGGAARSASRVENPWVMPSSTHTRRERILRAVGLVALLRRCGQEYGHQRDEGGRQPKQLGGNQRGHGVTQAGYEGASRALVSRAPRPVHGFGRAGSKN